MKPEEFDAMLDFFVSPKQRRKAHIERLAKHVNDITTNYHKGNQESVAANRSVARVAQKKRILSELRHWETQGLTCDALELLTGYSHQSCSARCSELRRDGLIRKIGIRKTKSGCNASVYKAV